MFLATMLQRDPMVHRGSDIRLLLTRHLENWRCNNFDDLVTETERCARQLPHPRYKDEKDHCIKIFTRLMLRGQVHAAV